MRRLSVFLIIAGLSFSVSSKELDERDLIDSTVKMTEAIKQGVHTFAGTEDIDMAKMKELERKRSLKIETLNQYEGELRGAQRFFALNDLLTIGFLSSVMTLLLFLAAIKFPKFRRFALGTLFVLLCSLYINTPRTTSSIETDIKNTRILIQNYDFTIKELEQHINNKKEKKNA